MKHVLVTGASRGIGKAIALRLGRAGFSITVHCRRREAEAQAVAAEIIAAGGVADVLCVDVRDRDAVRAALETRLHEKGFYYGVVCNAGLIADGAFPALTGEDWDSVLDTSLDGFFNVVQPLVMPLARAKQGGRIITLASVSGVMGNRGQVNYSAAKAGLIGATKALAVELASRKITVNCVAPGLIETDMVQDVPLDEALKMVPMNRMGRAEEVAATVAFLMSEDAAYITRQVIGVNGGII